jgi:hypothetical protein
MIHTRMPTNEIITRRGITRHITRHLQPRKQGAEHQVSNNHNASHEAPATSVSMHQQAGGRDSLKRPEGGGHQVCRQVNHHQDGHDQASHEAHIASQWIQKRMPVARGRASGKQNQIQGS